MTANEIVRFFTIREAYGGLRQMLTPNRQHCPHFPVSTSMAQDEPFVRALPAQVGRSRTRASDVTIRGAVGWAVEFALPFALVLYLALQGGGYDVVVRGEIGIAVWWLVLLAAVAGVVPRVSLGRAGWIVVGSFLAFAIWTGIGISWSASAERSVLELGRAATLLGILVIALAAQGRGQGLRRIVGAVAAAIGVVASLALLSRFQPSWFPANEVADYLPTTEARLNYPLNYWNGLAALIAVGIPLYLSGAAGARSIVVRAVATGVLPALALAVYLTLSRGGAVEVVAGVVILLALHPRRLRLLQSLLLGAAGAAILIAAAGQREALRAGQDTPTALSQGHEMLAMTLIVSLGVGLLAAAVALAGRYGLFRLPHLSRSSAAVMTGAALVLALGVAVSSGATNELSNAWDQFKQPVGPGEGIDRFSSASGNGRYQWWEAAIDASATDRLTGIGPGTFEYFWATEGSIPGFVRDAHSLYLEALAETGLVGLLLIMTFVLGGAGLVARRSLRRKSAEQAALLAAAAAAMSAFAVAAAIDWAWEMTVLPVTFLLLLAGALATRSHDGDSARPNRNAGAGPRAGLALVALAALAAIVVPMAATQTVRDSQSLALRGELDAALEEARRAGTLQPYAASPLLQEALVLEELGDLPRAAAAAAQATQAEATNWRTWLVLSRLEARLGRTEASIQAFRQARELNPRSPLFSP
jgi:hypothetical protein